MTKTGRWIKRWIKSSIKRSAFFFSFAFFSMFLGIGIKPLEAKEVTGDAYGKPSGRIYSWVWESGCGEAGHQAARQMFKDPEGTENGHFLGNYAFKKVWRTSEEGGKNKRCQVTLEYGSHVVKPQADRLSFEFEQGYQASSGDEDPTCSRDMEESWVSTAISGCLELKGFEYQHPYSGYGRVFYPIFSEFKRGSTGPDCTLRRKVTCMLFRTNASAYNHKAKAKTESAACDAAKSLVQVELEKKCSQDRLVMQDAKFYSEGTWKVAGSDTPWNCSMSGRAVCRAP